jgi:hypothetical protein
MRLKVVRGMHSCREEGLELEIYKLLKMAHCKIVMMPICEVILQALVLIPPLSQGRFCIYGGFSPGLVISTRVRAQRFNQNELVQKILTGKPKALFNNIALAPLLPILFMRLLHPTTNFLASSPNLNPSPSIIPCT